MANLSVNEEKATVASASSDLMSPTAEKQSGCYKCKKCRLVNVNLRVQIE